MPLVATEALQQLPVAILPRLIQLFGSTTPAMLTNIRQHADSGNLIELGKAAHKLKGSCVSLGAVQMSDLCKTLQHKGEGGDASGVNALVTELETLYPATLQALQQAV